MIQVFVYLYICVCVMQARGQNSCEARIQVCKAYYWREFAWLKQHLDYDRLINVLKPTITAGGRCYWPTDRLGYEHKNIVGIMNLTWQSYASHSNRHKLLLFTYIIQKKLNYCTFTVPIGVKLNHFCPFSTRLRS